MINNKDKVELLSPAGDIESGYAAIHYGADAVYLGLPKFSARFGATNFKEEELSSFVVYAHSRGKKVFLALNTLICEREQSAIIDILFFAEEIGIDGIIVQDIGLGRLIKKHFPRLRLHGSTQMAVHNRAGAEALKEMGYNRVVLARELTLEEIRDISSIEGIETEVFIHGALCYSYSGLCLFSSLTTGCSANRGRCLYPCRKAYNFSGHSEHLFSMKDLAQREEVLKILKNSTVRALKIEGRKKNALYVAAVTDFYRCLLDKGEKDKRKEKNMQMIFARPWTKLYLNSRKSSEVIDRDFVGHRGLCIGFLDKLSHREGGDYIHIIPSVDIGLHDGLQIDIPGREKPYGFAIDHMQDNSFRFRVTGLSGKSIWIRLPKDHPYIPEGSAIYISSSSYVKGFYDYLRPNISQYKRREPIDVKLIIQEDKIIAESSLGGRVEYKDKFLPAKQEIGLKERAFESFSKTGETKYVLNSFSYLNSKSLFVPVSILNDIRRQLYAQEVSEEKSIKINYPTQIVTEQRYILKTDNISSLSLLTEDDFAGIFELIVSGTEEEINNLSNKVGKGKIRISIPVISRYWDNEKNLFFIRSLLSQGYKKWEIGNLSGLKMLPISEVDFSTDWSIYTLNRESASEIMDLKASRFTLSPEDSLDNIKEITKSFGLYSTFIMYQDTPLFISETDIQVGEDIILRSTDGFFRKIKRGHRVYVIGEEAISLATRAKETGAGFLRGDFILREYTPEEVLRIWRQLVLGKEIPHTTQGNFNRGF